MLYKKLNDLVLSDFQQLIENGVGESKSLEYKRELKIETGDDKTEFLADVSAFANADGGDIIFGIAEDDNTHLPIDICGILIDNKDEKILQIENLLRDCIEPRIPDLSIRAIKTDSEGVYVLIIRVKQSYISPHRVKRNKFYLRNTGGKHEMDVSELRTSFNMSQELNKRIDMHIVERSNIITENKYKLLLDGYPIFILQFLPVSAFLHNEYYDLLKIDDALKYSGTSAFGVMSNWRITVDGIRIGDGYRAPMNPSFSAFAHYKTNGIIEKATTLFFNPEYVSRYHNPPSKIPIIYRNELIDLIIMETKQCLHYLQKVECC